MPPLDGIVDPSRPTGAWNAIRGWTELWVSLVPPAWVFVVATVAACVALLPIRCSFFAPPLVFELRWGGVRCLLMDSRLKKKNKAKKKGKRKEKRRKPSEQADDTTKKKTEGTLHKVPKGKLKAKYYFALLGDPLTVRILSSELRLLKKLTLPFADFRLDLTVGLSDYYRQGLLEALLGNLPQFEKLRIRGNFLEKNRCEFSFRTNLFQLSKALLGFVFFQPWGKIFRLLRKAKRLKNA